MSAKLVGAIVMVIEHQLSGAIQSEITQGAWVIPAAEPPKLWGYGYMSFSLYWAAEVVSVIDLVASVGARSKQFRFESNERRNPISLL